MEAFYSTSFLIFSNSDNVVSLFLVSCICSSSYKTSLRGPVIPENQHVERKLREKRQLSGWLEHALLKLPIYSLAFITSWHVIPFEKEAIHKF